MKRQYEKFIDGINAVPYDAMIEILNFVNLTKNDMDILLVKLCSHNINDFQKQQIAEQIMNILKNGKIDLRLYSTGYSIEHIKFILDDLNNRFSNLYTRE